MRTACLAKGRPLTIAVCATLLAAVFGPATGRAQAMLRGRVIDSEFGTPLGGAIVGIQRLQLSITTDSLGQFEARDLPPGKVTLTIGAIGYRATRFTVTVPATGTVEGAFPLDFNGYQLPEVAVQARVELLVPRYLEFERRRQNGMGAYLRWDEIAKKGYGSVGDALRTIRGVRIECNQATFECLPVMVRSPQCHPTWWIDGVEVHSFQENTPIRDVYGIEVYRGPGEVPAEYSGSDAMCGVIVMWTKSRPFRTSQ